MVERRTGSARWFRGLFGGGDDAVPPPHPGREAIEAGGRALWAVAVRVVDVVHAVDVPFGGSDVPDVEGAGVFGRPAVARREAEPRVAAAAAVGAALAGRRSAAFVGADSLPALVPTLRSAARRHAPLTVVAAAEPDDAGVHDPFHAAATAGVPVFVARDAQHAVDLLVLAVRVAEDHLTPVVVGIDGPSAAWAPTTLRVPEPEFLRAWLGEPDGSIDPPTATQRSWFAGPRRRVPRWFDPDRPALTGARLTGPAVEAAAAADRAILDAERDAGIVETAVALERQIGRPVLTAPEPDVAGAIAIVAIGEDVGAARAAVAAFDPGRGRRPGVVDVPSLVPFPAATLRAACAEAAAVVVLDRVSHGRPLHERVRSALDGADRPAPASWTWIRPRGAAVLAALRRGETATDAHLGAAPADDVDSPLPKRQIALQRLRRDYPGLRDRLVSPDPFVDLRPSGSRTVLLAVRRPDWPREEADAAARALSARVGDAVGGRVLRGGHGHWTVEMTAAPTPFTVSGDPAPPEIVVAIDPEPAAVPEAPAGCVVLARTRDDGSPDLPPDWIRAAAERGWTLRGRPDLTDRLDAAIRDALEGAFDDLPVIEVRPPDAPAAVDGSLPAVVRRFEHAGDDWAGLPRFWSEWIEPGRAGDLSPPVADPFPSLRAVPPYTATLDDRCGDRERTPSVDPAKCTACGRCWTTCPESAILPVAFGSRVLLETAVDAVAPRLSDARHPAVGKIRRALKNVAAKLDARVAVGGTAPPSADDVRGACHDVVESLGLDDADRVVADRVVDELCGWIDGLPVVAAEATFHAAHRETKGTGDLLLLAVDPAACNGCGICTRECADDAIDRVPGTGDVAAMRRAVRAWEALPDTAGESIRRLASRDDVGPMASILLSRHASCTVLGGGDSAPGSGARMAVRLTTAAAESARQPAVAAHVRALDDLAGQLESAVRDEMAHVVPVDDLEALDRALDGVARRPGNAGEVVERLREAGGAPQVDTVRTRHLLNAIRTVRARRRRWTAGDDGQGRARFALVLAGRRVAAWAAGFPHNPFGVPVTVDEPEDGADVAAGLARVLRDEAVDEARTVRMARLRLDDPDDLPERERELESLTWDDLDRDERGLATRVVVIVDGDGLRGAGRAGIPRLLATGLPVTVLAVDDGDPLAPGPDPVLTALAHRDAYVVAASPSHADLLFRGATAAFTFDGPSFVHVLAPEPGVHGFATEDTVERARRAVRARVQPLVRYDPSADGVFGLRLDLDGNPRADARLADDGDAAPEPAGWAAAERRYAAGFRPLADGEVGTPIARWLTVSPDARGTDFPTVPGPNGGCLGVGATVRDAALRRLDLWRTLQELAGIETPFTERVRERIATETEAAHRDALDGVRRDYEAKLAEQRAALDAEQVERLRDRLLQLAGYDPSKAGPATGSGEGEGGS